MNETGRFGDGRSHAMLRAVCALVGVAPHAIDGATARALSCLADAYDSPAVLLYAADDTGWRLGHAHLAGHSARSSLVEAQAAGIERLDGRNDGSPDDDPKLSAFLRARGAARRCVMAIGQAGDGPRGALVLGCAKGRLGDCDHAALQLVCDALLALWESLDRSAWQTRGAGAPSGASVAALDRLVLVIDPGGMCREAYGRSDVLGDTQPAALIGCPIAAVLPPDLVALHDDALAHARTEGSVEVSLARFAQDGARRWHSLAVSARAGDREQGGHVVTIRDVTEPREREEDDRRLRHVVRLMTNRAALLDRGGALVWMDPAFAKAMGRAQDSLLGQSYLSSFDVENERAQVDLLRSAIWAGYTQRVELCRTDPQGHRRWIDVMIRPLANGTEDGSAFVVIETEVTERRNAEAAAGDLERAARAARDQLEAAIGALPDGFGHFDATGVLAFCNQRFSDYAAHLDRQDITAGQEPGTWRTLLSPGQPDEQRLPDGRWLRLLARPTPDGGRIIMLHDISEARHAQLQLQSVIANAAICLWDIDLGGDEGADPDGTPDGGRVHFDAHWHRMLGFAPEAEGDGLMPRWQAEDRVRFASAVASLARGDTRELSLEIRLRDHEESWRSFMLRGGVAQRDLCGRATRLSGVAIDVTRRQRSEERLGAILRATRVGTWRHDALSGRVVIDHEYAAMIGYTLAELSPFDTSRLHELVHADDLPMLLGRSAAAHAEPGGTIRQEYRILHKDGRWRWMQAVSQVTRWVQAGVPAEEIGVVFDMTERTEREAALADAKLALERALVRQRETEQRLSDIAEATDDWFWEIDAAGRLLYVSGGFERSTRLRIADVIGQPVAHLIAPYAPDEMRTALPRGVTELLAGNRPLDKVLRLRSKHDGSPVFIHLKGGCIRDLDGNVTGLRGVGANVTAMMRATEQAQAASEAKSRFLATMSHELRTPLTAVLGMADLLADTSLDPEQRGILDTIRGASEGLLAILNDILDLAKIEAGKLEIEHCAFSPCAVLHDVATLFAPLSRGKGLDFDCDADPDCAVIRLGDANRLRQILHNLLGNALKFTERGKITLRLRADAKDALLISVADTGIGMTDEQLARVFDAFEQAESTTARRYGGTGLGLSISRQLAEIMNGQMSVASRSGEGTIVTLRLPLPRAVECKQPAPEPDSGTGTEVGNEPETRHNGGGQRMKGLKVLIADDNATNRKILEVMLRKSGIETVLTCDGLEAVAAYPGADVQVLFLDISMPGLDGIGTLKAIRAFESDHALAPVPAYAVTANAMTHQVEAYIGSGFAGHIAKPFNKAEIMAVLAAHVAE